MRHRPDGSDLFPMTSGAHNLTSMVLNKQSLIRPVVNERVRLMFPSLSLLGKCVVVPELGKFGVKSQIFVKQHGK